jgi:BirA family biotin operon repressor/biotin-[acetyl-CoA-carboxylase] ligase
MITFEIERLAEVTSTNTLAMQRARQEEPEGLVLVADHQTHGRGKPGRVWVSPKGKNLLCSILLRPPIKPSEAPVLTQVACRAVAKALRTNYDIHSTFKRPNDILVEGKKICGILTEAISKAGLLEAVVIGIGLNVNAEADELPPEGTSMRLVSGKTFELMAVLEDILECLNDELTVIYTKSAVKK